MTWRSVHVLGLGVASSLGDGAEAHRGWQDLTPVMDEARFAPHPVHPLAPLPFDKTIPRRESRQMENWQRLGTHAAGLAIADAGLADRVAEMDLIVAAGGGERDAALDGQILASRPDEAGLHAALMNGLRPTLFLAQLSNLLAGSISIVHGVGGSSRTLMGEEIAGAETMRMAWARVAAGSSTLALAGGAFLAERPEIMLLHAMGGRLHRGPCVPMDEREGMVLGSAAAFLLLGTGPGMARLAHVATDQGPPEGSEARLDTLLAAAPPARPGAIEIWAGPFGTLRPGLRLADRFGHSVEAAFPLAVALGAMMVRDGAPEIRIAMRGAFRGEAVAVLEPSE
ncbi:beta-ketoacyl synthase N-terminal-like domain-containing protein [Sabulicella rubraurantiaca]|uniref:beta-ketoacyl synthase N-terminal-like domain-containing protein n=1 Tax=Sabulicella rubraurantiaca TaxID=2811429 RepID=UPI001A9631B8|nr:beta-ketoacyl synthase N-terminal-like domain-containing protein [Sabulicella rubraurantiaca]